MSHENNVNIETIWHQYGINMASKGSNKLATILRQNGNKLAIIKNIYNKIELEKRQYNIIN